MPDTSPAISFIGFGEAGQAMAAGLRTKPAWSGYRPGTFLFPQSAEGEEAAARPAQRVGVRCANVDAADAVREADMVISAVTAASSVEAAQSVKAHLAAKPFFLDINSVSPGRKQETAKLLGAAARYVDVAVLAPIYPARHQTPMLLAGPHAEANAPALAALGMRVSVAGAEVGAAAAIKMVRSVMIKGIEALTLECFGRGARRRDRRGGRLDEEQLSGARLEQDRALQSRTHGEPRRTPRRRNGRSRRHVARTRRRAADGVGHRQAPAWKMGQIGKQQSVRGVLNKKTAPEMLSAISAAARHRH